ncbi:hypothetical protein [Arsenophonus endosymbiont of Aleurodicus floccissimus]|uniref:hypothetical protein n=1 Tax=Arsenophonus endosymbiont of Aleurodicus floccissimus TaxID=2152761 RepID=UPI000E6B3D93|nr:hypothetical protein [Arsenophonus endosymbiont of Aleurodicus floccissimus]
MGFLGNISKGMEIEIYNPFIYKAPIFYKNDDNGDNADIDFPKASNKKAIIDNSELQLNELKS